MNLLVMLLICSMQVVFPPSGWHSASLPTEPDEYYDLFRRYEEADNIESRRKTLQSYARYLRDGQMYDAWIRSYAGRRACVGEAKRRAEEARAFLLREGITKDRIKVIDAGYLNNWSVDLWVVVRGKPDPPPYPTLKRKDVRVIKDQSKCPKPGSPSI
jgi:hypothetical protein